MTPKMAAIFDTDPSENRFAVPVVDVADNPVVAPDPVVNKSWPIIEGTEHFSLWLRSPGVPSPGFVKAWANEPWPEFIPGYHHDIRQPSRLRPLLSRPVHPSSNREHST